MFHAKEYVKAESLEQAYELNPEEKQRSGRRYDVAENEQREPEYGD